MGGDSVVPYNDGVGPPLYTSLVISALVDVVVQEPEYHFWIDRSSVNDKEHAPGPSSPRTRLLAFESDNAPRELPVDVECFLASHRMLADHGVDMFHRLPAHDPASATRAREVSLLDTRVNGLERS